MKVDASRDGRRTKSHYEFDGSPPDKDQYQTVTLHSFFTFTALALQSKITIEKFRISIRR